MKTTNNLFKNAHLLAKAMKEANEKQGFSASYKDMLAIVWKFRKENRLNELNTLVKKSVIKSLTIGEKSAPKTAPTKTTEATEEIEIPSLTLEFNWVTLPNFSAEVENTVNELRKSVIEGNKYFAGWKSLKEEKRDMKVNAEKEAVEKLPKAENIHELQTIVISYYMENAITRIAYKMLKNGGANYKSLEKRDESQLMEAFSYMNASSNSGELKFAEAVEIYNEIVIKSYELLFDENQFDNENNFFKSLYFRVSNTMRTEIRRHAKFKANLGHEIVLEVYDKGNRFHDNYFTNIVEFAIEEGIINEEEKEILNLKLEGYNKKEIASMMGKSQNYYNRTWKKIENTLSEYAKF